jgi:hypothetical protein
VELFVNGHAMDFEPGDGEGIDLVLARVDELLEKAGSVIVGLGVDGRSIGPDELEAVQNLRVSEVGRVDVAAEDASEYRAKAIGLLLDLVALAGRASAGEDGQWEPLKQDVAGLADTLSGLFPADELSFVQGFSALVGTVAAEAEVRGGSPSPETKTDFAARIQALETFFRERLAELDSPVAEMRRTAALFEDGAEELRELPVYLQTGKEERAMKAVILFIEIFNKVIRLIPELRRRGIDTTSIRVEGLELPAFYASFNQVLRSLSGAIENKDSVLLGDLAEYEVAPRMGSFFTAMEQALPQ